MNTKNLLFFLGFRLWKVFHRLFHFSICMSCLLTGLPGRPVIFTFHLLLNIEHQLEYFSHLIVRSNNFLGPLLPPFIVLANHSYAYKIVCIVLPDCCFYFNFIFSLWVFLNSKRIQKDPDVCSTRPKQPKFSIHKAKKNLRLTVHCRNNAKNLF